MTSFDAFDNFPYRIYIRDAKKILYANKIAQEFIGTSAINIIGKEFEEVFQDLNYLEHIKRMKKYFFEDKNETFSSLKELNRCFSKPEMLQIVEFIEEYESNPVIVSILISIKDDNYPDKILPLSNIGDYEPTSRRVKLYNGEIIKLTSLENLLLFILNKQNSQVVNYEEIFLSIDPYNKMSKVSLKSLVFRLNKKIKNVIKCESMQGYYIK